MIDYEWLSSVQSKNNADTCLIIYGETEIIEWASENFRSVVAVSGDEVALRQSVSHLQNVTVLGKIGKTGVEFALLHLHGKTIVIVRKGISAYQVIMVYLRNLLACYRVIGVAIEDAGNSVRNILEGLLDTNDYSLERNGESLLVTRNQ